MSNSAATAGFALIFLLLLLIVFTPWITIWALNTLFNLGIAYTFWTWLAAAWLSIVTFGSVTSAINKKN